jgi:LAGLIDADG-like domain
MAYDMNQNELLEAAARLTPQWVAGFFDGEGCVTSSKDRQGHATLHVCVAQSEPKILVLLQGLLGGSFSINTTRGSRGYKLYWNGRNSLSILEYIKDHVICKRRQVEAGIEFAKLFGPGGRVEITNVNHDLREGYALIIRDSNHGIDTKEP